MTGRVIVIAESVPGAAAAIAALARESGGWVCEQHLHRPWPHDDCPGPGVLREAA